MAIRFGLLTAVLSLVLACGGSSTQPPPPQPINPPSSPAASARPAASPAAAAPTSNPSASPTAARAVPATPVIVAGTPAAGQLSVTALQQAWELRNYRVLLSSAGGTAAGFTAPAAEVRLVYGDTSTQITLLVYPSPQALELEWDIKPGTAPTPKAGKETPGVLATWWNNNVVALVRSRTGEPSPDALNAFLDARP